MVKHEIDAQGKILGRVATEAAIFLRGKNKATFQPHIPGDTIVTITNASKLAMTSKKMKEKKYTHYTGYPGGLRERSMEKIINDKGYEEVLRKAIYGMLPANKLRKIIMKNLIITA